MFEKAKWITGNPWHSWHYTSSAEEMPASSYITKGFTVKGVIKSAVVNICGLGQAAYYVNSQRIPNSYLPTHPTNPLRAVIYNTYDITNMLKVGRNRIGVILGNNSYNDISVQRWRSNTKMICELVICYVNGECETVISDSSWKTAPSPILFSMRKCGEKYDSRLEIKDWCSCDFDDVDFKNVEICKGPGGVLRSTVCPPVRVLREICGEETARGLFDFKEIVCGWVKIIVKGNTGNELVIKYAERITADGLHSDQKGIISGYEYMSHKDRYIMSGCGEETFEQLFSYHGFRYVEICGEYDYITVTARVAHTDISPISSFYSDNKIINSIHSACVNSILSNSQGALVDCPTREQNEWTGDGMLSAESAVINFDCYNMFYEWMQKFKEEQMPNGALPCIIPSKNLLWEANFASGTDWDSAIFHIPYYSFKYSGNPDIVNLMWENMNLSLSYFSTLSENNLMANGVGDWCGLQPMCNKEITDTAYYRIDALMMAEMAEATGRDNQKYLKLADDIKTDFRSKYIKNGRLIERNETALSAALYSGMYTETEAKREVRLLNDILVNNGYRFLCGVHGLRMIFDVLSHYGYTETLFKTVINDEYPGYAFCIKKGLNTLPERFDFEHFIGDTDSLNHHFRSPVDTWFYKYLAGIRFEGFGFNNIVIEPHFVTGIESLSAELRGIRISYDKEKVNVMCHYPFRVVLDGIKRQMPSGEYCFKR